MRKSISQLNMLSPEEYRQITCGLNDTAGDYPREKCVHTLFEEQVANNPDKTAVIACDRELTYGELNEQANRIAHSLIDIGIRPGDIVAFMLPRKSYLLSVMFGILKSGAAYLPIDPDYPQERIDYMLSDSAAKLCITEENLPNLLANQHIENPNVQMSSVGLCYCIYTSGSTGRPKGVMIRHQNLVNFCQNNNNNYQSCAIREGSRVASLFKVCFDAFQMDSALFLLNGRSLLLVADTDLTEYGRVATLISNHHADVLHCTPTMLRTLLAIPSFLPALRLMKVCMCGAEVFSPDMYFSFRRTSNAHIFNGYGPSETTIAVSFGEMDKNREYACKSATQTIAELNVLSQAETKMLRYAFNDTYVDYPRGKCVHTLFEEQVGSSPDKTAVIACDQELTYGELNEQANRIAHSLIGMGIQPGDIVAFMLPRKSYLLSVMFGILKSGAAYLPIDPDYPQERIDYMLSDSEAKLCVTEKNVFALLEGDHTEDPDIPMTSDGPCYCIYTSGSTGKPKGTLISHRNVSNFCTNSAENHFANRFLNKCMILASTNSIAFDIVLQEIHLPLLNGVPVLLLSTVGYLNEREIKQLYAHREIGFITTPVKINLLMQSSKFCKALRHMSAIMIGADVLTKTLVEQVRKYTDAVIINGYGPTETTCGVTYSAVNK